MDTIERVPALTYVWGETDQNGTVTASFITNINQELFQEHILMTNSGYSMRVLLVNSNGQILADSRAQDVGRDAEAIGWLKSVLTSKDQFGTYSWGTFWKGGVVVFSEVAYKRLFFVGYGDYKDLHSSLVELRTVLWYLTGGFLLGSLVIIIFFVRSIYGPIRRVTKLLRRQLKLNEPGDGKNYSEYDLLFRTLDVLRDTENNDRVLRRRNYVKKIIQGEISSGAFPHQEIEELLNIPLKDHLYVVCVLRMDGMSRLSADHTLYELAGLRFSILALVQKHFFHNVLFEALDTDNDELVVLVSFPPQSDGKERKELVKKFSQIVEIINNSLGLYLSVSIGQPVSHLNSIHAEYEKTRYCTNYRFFQGRGAVILSDEYDEQSRGLYAYPLDLEKK